MNQSIFFCNDNNNGGTQSVSAYLVIMQIA